MNIKNGNLSNHDLIQTKFKPTLFGDQHSRAWAQVSIRDDEHIQTGPALEIWHPIVLHPAFRI